MRKVEVFIQDSKFLVEYDRNGGLVDVYKVYVGDEDVTDVLDEVIFEEIENIVQSIGEGYVRIV